MLVLIVLLAGLVAFRALGALGVRRFDSWSSSAAHAMAAMLVLTASAHFAPSGVTVMPNHADMVAMVPPFVPFADAMVYATGVLELLGAVGLVITATRWAAAVGLAVLYVLLLPANIYAAVEDIPFHGEAPTPLVQRIPEQLLYIAIALWIARTAELPRTLKLLLTRASAGPMSSVGGRP